MLFRSATTAGFLQGKDPNQVFGSSLVNNLINVNLANLNAGKGSEPEPTKKAETPNDILTAYNSLNDLDKTFVNTAVMTGTDLETAVNYAMANPTMTTSMKDGVQYAALDTGTRTDAGGGNYWTLNADGSVRTDPSGNSEVKNADGTWPSEAPPPVSESKPEFKYNSDGSIDELQKDGSYQRINDIKLDESGKIMTLDNGQWTDTGTYAKGTEAMRATGDSQYTLNKDELSQGYYYASDGSMRTPDGSFFVKIYGTSDSTPQQAYTVAPESSLSDAFKNVGGILGLGGGDPNATYRALFGGGEIGRAHG